MMRITRRSVHRMTFAGFGSLLAASQSRFAGVTLGIQTFSFRGLSLDEAIQAMVEIGCSECELGGSQIGPRPSRAAMQGYMEKLRQWRLTVPLQEIEKIGDKFRAAGINLGVYTYNLYGGTDAEIDRGFEMAKAMGAKALSMSTRISLVPRVDAAARRYKIRVGLHNHSRIAPDQLATPEDFGAALRGRSEYIAVTLDIGHFFAAGFDPVQFLRQNHDVVLNVHLKDRKKDQGPKVPFGEGDTPIIEALRIIRDNKYNIAAYIEYEYPGKDTVAEVRRCFEYAKRALLT